MSVIVETFITGWMIQMYPRVLISAAESTQ